MLEELLHFVEAAKDPEARVDGETHHLQEATDIGAGTDHPQPAAVADFVEQGEEAGDASAVDVRRVGELQE